MKVRLLSIMGIILSVIACTSKADKQYGPLKTVDKVDIQKFMGKWYVIANIPTFIEKGAHNAIEIYTWNESRKRIDVDFKFNADSFDGELKSYPQKAWVYDKNSMAYWKVQPLWPFKFSYLVIDLDEKYSYTVIAVPDRDYIWIMARTPQMDKTQLDRIIDRAQNEWGFDTSKIQMVPQKPN